MKQLTPAPGSPDSPVNMFGLPKEGVDPAVPATPADALAEREALMTEREAELDRREKLLDAKLEEKGFALGPLTQAEVDQMVVGTYAFCAYDVLKDNGNLHPETIVALKCTTIAVLVLRNGFVLVGESVCASPEAYDAATGLKWAVADAKRQVWPLENYVRKGLRNGLFPGAPAAKVP